MNIIVDDNKHIQLLVACNPNDVVLIILYINKNIITSLSILSIYDNKSMIIKVTDEELIEKTGGIIQGMSGAPILQNGKFIGAVTHVLVNDSKVGYAVFADMMIKQMREVE